MNKQPDMALIASFQKLSLNDRAFLRLMSKLFRAIFPITIFKLVTCERNRRLPGVLEQIDELYEMAELV